jgi:hypothetical protein
MPVRVWSKEFLQPANHRVPGMPMIMFMFVVMIMLVMLVVIVPVGVFHKEPPKEICEDHRVRSCAKKPSNQEGTRFLVNILTLKNVRLLPSGRL